MLRSSWWRPRQFVIVKPYNTLQAKLTPEAEGDAETRACPECTTPIAAAARRCPHCTSQIAPA
jgi:large conductance mechanosensitive channel